MLSEFFQLQAIPANQMTGTYNTGLVILSYIVAVVASYIALDITGRLREGGMSSLRRSLWIGGGAFAMGAGIWSMHFIGMLAFTMPKMNMTYDLFWTAISLLVAIFASSFAFFLLKSYRITFLNLIFGGVILGLAIASMHYVGMHAMSGSMTIHYLPGLFVLSIVIAILASEAAIWLALKSNQVVYNLQLRLKIISAFIMGAAICGMHYTGMAAAVFTPASNPVLDASTIDPEILAISIAGVTFIILGIAIFVSSYQASLHQKSLVIARQAGMSDVATSVLHNVGNVLNSINVSVKLLNERTHESKLGGLQQLSKLLMDNKDRIGQFITDDPRGKNVPEYISMLSTYWQHERTAIINELESLDKNISMIKNIIAMQQELGKVTGVEQIVSISTVIDESLVISGINSIIRNIRIEKNITHIEPVLTDKLKLVQVLVNLFKNAKDSLTESTNTDKLIKINAGIDGKDKYFIQIIDNGVGIPNENKTLIFNYGFTTKSHGHGFGLHSSANTLHQMEGSLEMESAGVNQGAKFTLKLPYKLPGI